MMLRRLQRVQAGVLSRHCAAAMRPARHLATESKWQRPAVVTNYGGDAGGTGRWQRPATLGPSPTATVNVPREEAFGPYGGGAGATDGSGGGSGGGGGGEQGGNASGRNASGQSWFRVLWQPIVATWVFMLASYAYDLFNDNTDEHEARYRESRVRAHHGEAKTITVNGRKMNVEIAGTGSPTVIINAGTTNAAAELVILISKHTRVISYTHAGLMPPKVEGSSKTPAVPASGSTVPHSQYESDELSGVLNALDVQDNIILVSTYYNWMSTLKSASKNAAYVSGVVLVDPLLPAAAGQGAQVPFLLVPPVKPGDPEAYLRSGNPFVLTGNSSITVPSLFDEHLARLSIFNNPHHARFDMGEIGSNWVAALLQHSFLVNSPVRGDPRIEYLAQQRRCLKVEDGLIVTGSQTPLQTACEQSSNDSPRPLAPHTGLMKWVRQSFNGGTGGGTLPMPSHTYPLAVLVSRVPKEPRFMTKTLMEPLSLLMFGTVRTSLSKAEEEQQQQLVRHSTHLGQVWSTALPNRVVWLPSQEPISPAHQSFMYDPSEVAKTVVNMVAHTRRIEGATAVLSRKPTAGAATPGKK